MIGGSVHRGTIRPKDYPEKKDRGGLTRTGGVEPFFIHKREYRGINSYADRSHRSESCVYCLVRWSLIKNLRGVLVVCAQYEMVIDKLYSWVADVAVYWAQIYGRP